MTAQPIISKQKLTDGDFVGFDVTTFDADETDFTVWCKIYNVRRIDGFRAYDVVFPDGSPRRTPVLAKHVTKFKKGFPDAVCSCGTAVSTNFRYCPKCERDHFPF